MYGRGLLRELRAEVCDKGLRQATCYEGAYDKGARLRRRTLFRAEACGAHALVRYGPPQAGGCGPPIPCGIEIDRKALRQGAAAGCRPLAKSNRPVRRRRQEAVRAARREIAVRRMGRRRTARTCVRPSGSSLRSPTQADTSNGPSPPKAAARRRLRHRTLVVYDSPPKHPDQTATTRRAPRKETVGPHRRLWSVSYTHLRAHETG